MKEFSIQEQVYICKNANSKTLEQIAIATTSTIKEVKDEYNIMKQDGRYEKYRKMTNEEIRKLIEKQSDLNEEETQNNTLLGLNDYLMN